MEQHGIVLRGIARVLNAGGCALVNAYDAVASLKTSVLPGEKGNLKAKLREYEKKLERLYYEIGKEVALREYTGQTSAAGEAGIKRAAEYRAEIEEIKQRIKEIEEGEKAATENAIDRTGVKAEPEADAREPAPSEAPVAGEALQETETEEVKGIVGEAAATPEHEFQKDAPASEEPVAGEASTGAAATDTEVLELLLKSDLLKICSERGIEANKRMTKVELIELISGRS